MSIFGNEDSYDRMLEGDRQFAAQGPTLEETVVSSLWMQDLMGKLSPQEREIIYQLYVLEKSEREASAALHLAQTTFRRRKKALLEKLRTLLEENSGKTVQNRPPSGEINERFYKPLCTLTNNGEDPVHLSM